MDVVKRLSRMLDVSFFSTFINSLGSEPRLWIAVSESFEEANDEKDSKIGKRGPQSITPLSLGVAYKTFFILQRLMDSSQDALHLIQEVHKIRALQARTL